MMEMLKNWVRDLVILSIFASLIEMLLPGGSLKKYVKVVLGFFLMLAILNPLLTLIRADYRAFYPFQTTPDQKIQRQIQRQGSDLQQQNAELARANLESQLAQQMRALILTQEEVADAKVRVTAGAGGKIELVHVSLILSSEDEQHPVSPEVTRVQNVSIQVGKPGTVQEPKSSSEPQKVQKVQKQVQKLLASWYNVQPGVIQFEE